MTARGGARRLLRAALLSLLVNGVLLALVAELNRHVKAHVGRARPAEEAIHFQPPPRKKQPRRVRQKVIKSRPRAVPLPIPDLPSRVFTAAVPPEVGEVDMSADLVGYAGDWDAALVLREEAVDEPPRVISRVSPEYPPMAEERGIEGWVVVKLQVSTSGRVRSVRVVSAEPPGVFETAAERAARQYRFAAARFKGQPVQVVCRQRISFRLER